MAYSTLIVNTAFSNITELPKIWAFHNCHIPPYTSNPAYFESDGLKFTAPNITSGGFGLNSAGWNLSIVNPNFDMEIEFKEYSNNWFGNYAGLAATIPLYLIDSFTSDVSVVVRVIHSAGSHKVQFVNTVGGVTSEHAIPNITSGKLRLVRTGDIFEGFYDLDNTGWTKVGEIDASIVDTRFTNPIHRINPSLSIYRGPNPGQELNSFKLVNFKVNSGSITPDTVNESPADDFNDNILPTQPKWSGPVDIHGGGIPASTEETNGYLKWSAAVGGATSEGQKFTSNYVLFPGTDIDCITDIEFTLNNWEQNTGLYFYANTLDNLRDKWVAVVLRQANSPTIKARLIYQLGAGEIEAGSVILGSDVPARHTIRLKRINNVWSAYLDGNSSSFGTFVDTNGYITDNPLTPELFSGQYTGTGEQRMYDLTFTEGDWVHLNELIPPYINGLDPTNGETNVYATSDVNFYINDDDTGVDINSIIVDINETNILSSGSFISEWNSSTIVPSGVNGYYLNLIHDSRFDSGEIVTVEVQASDVLGNNMIDDYSFTIASPILWSNHQINVNTTQTVSKKITPAYRFNQFDEHGSVVGLQRLSEEKNWEFRRRIFDSFVNYANSSYRGLINGITRELGLSLYDVISINPKKDINNNFLASDPYIIFNNVYLGLYSDYSNNVLDWAIDRYQSGQNFDQIGQLLNKINSTAFFEASLKPGIEPHIRSMVILNQSNRERVNMEFIPQSTRFKLKNKYLVKNSIFFSNRINFRTEVETINEITSKGKYHVDYSNGIITCFSIPDLKESVRYTYIKYPFNAIGSSVILHDINNENFRTKMFEQVLQDDGSYINGLPTELGVDIINELMSLSPMYWGI